MSLALSPRPSSRPALTPRRLIILGATGSVGSSTVDLIRRNRDRYRIEALTANRNAQALAALARELGARFAAVADPDCYGALKEALSGSGIEAAAGPAAVVEAASRPADWIMAAISGASGLAPTLAALGPGRTVALANKECLVCAGAMFMRAAAAANATVLPVDSEHNAVFQALSAGAREDVSRIALTASGGPFRTFSKEALRSVTPEQALKHPNYAMGAKVTIDSAGLMNKGLELIEAHHLFGIPSSQLDALVHPEQVVHGLVEYRDGSVVAAMAVPDMRVPIAHCLAFPARLDAAAPRLDLARVGTLTFAAPDLDRFPALGLARRALEQGRGATTILNAANEVAVAEFLARRIPFLAIPALVEAALDAAMRQNIVDEPATLQDAVNVDHTGRSLAQSLLPEIAAKAL